MNTKVFTNKAVPIQLQDSIIYIIGADRIQNDLLAYYLEKETCATCLVGESINRIDIKNSEKNNRQWHLGLWDCNGKELQEILAELRTYRTHKFILTRTALFNVNIDRRIEETCLRHGVRGFFYEGEPLSRFILGIQYQYDTLGNRTQMITPENKTITYAYADARRLTSVTSDSRTYSMGYDDNGRRTSVAYPNNTAAAYTYDNNGNLTRLRHMGPGGSTLDDINYTYDNVNNRLSRINTSSFGIDAVSPDAMNYDTANQLLNFNSITFNYDANGNRIQKIDGSTNTAYIYDDENRLTRVEITGGTTSVLTYVYDPFGRRDRVGPS
jgi:YD repeat-containing protein